jgi:two-component system response regulator LytT
MKYVKQILRALIIDDEPYSRAELKHLLGQYSSLEVIEEAESGKEGLEKTLAMSPDVLFVDIEMGEMSGIDMVEVLQKLKSPPRIVFATAYPDYAAKAFRYGAVDYLLKPFAEEDIKETMDRLLFTFHAAEKASKDFLPTKLAIESEGTITYLTPNTILYCSRAERETLVYTELEVFRSKIPLKDLEEKLSEFPFFRTHKSFLVNLQKVERLIPWINGAYQLRVLGGSEDIPVSRNYAKKLRDLLEL